MDVKLRKWDMSLREDLIRICNSVDRTYLSERIPDPYTGTDADWWLNMVAEHDGKDSIYRAIVVDDKVVGTISIEAKADVMRKDAELGYFLLTEYWSQGIMTEAAKQICKIAFDELDIIRISSMVYSPNIASKRVLGKSGFTAEGLQRNAIYKDGNIWDACLFGKLKEEQ